MNFSGRYFQYKAEFSSQEAGLTPELYNVSVDYTILDMTPPRVSVISPQNKSYSNSSIQFNVSLDEVTSNCLFSLDNFATNTSMTKFNDTYFYYSASLNEGGNTARFSCSDIYGNQNNSVQVMFFIDSVAPTIDIAFPSNGDSYGYNNSINLNFSVFDINNNVGSCWYNLDGGVNITILNCQNTTFNAAQGSRIVSIYVNDSYNLQSSDFAAFNINVGAPTITLYSPMNVYLNYSDNIQFKYKPEDIDLANCELWGNFDGIWKKNSTMQAISNINNYFYLNLSDGNYSWNVKCNDSQGHESMDGNKSFYVDLTLPSLTLSQPSGKKTSRSNIALEFSASDANLQSCWYNIYRGLNVEIINTSISCYSSSSFNVTLDADFTLNLYANDSAGNINNIISSFSVDTSTTPDNTPSDGGSGGGGGGGIITPATNGTVTIKVEISGVSDLTIGQGESKTLSASVKNTGAKFLNKCKLIGGGQASSWISSKDMKGIAIGEIVDFVFSVNVPEDASDSAATLFISCSEGRASKDFKISVKKNSFDITIGSIEQKGSQLYFKYRLENDKILNQQLEVEFWLADESGTRIASGTDSFVFESASIEKQVVLEVPTGTSGEHILALRVNNGKSSDYKQENVLLGAGGGIIGRAILIAGGGKTVSIAIILVISVLVGILVIKRIIHNPLKEDRAGFVRLKLKKKGTVLIDSNLVEHLKKHTEGKNLRGKWIHVRHKNN
jgi:hypothetical protein